MKKLLIALVILIMTLILLAGGILIWTLVSGEYVFNENMKNADERLSDLREGYEESQSLKLSESEYVKWNNYLPSAVKYNQLQMIASHNSFKGELVLAAKVFHNTIGVVAGQKYNEFNYWHQPLTDQLNSGVRSFELDVSKQVIEGEDEILCVHSRMFDSNSVTPLIDHALQELKLWSINNPSHMPITIIIEPKSEYLWYKSLQPFDNEMLEYLEEKISGIIGDSLYTPMEMLGENADFIALRENDDYPLVDDMRGKFVFVLHRSSLDVEYSAKSIDDQKLFLCVTNLEDKNAIFILQNNSDADGFMNEIDQSLEDHFIIRTRIDEFPILDEERKENAYNSGANILSTDYVPRVDETNERKYKYHENTFDGYTVTVK